MELPITTAVFYLPNGSIEKFQVGEDGVERIFQKLSFGDYHGWIIVYENKMTKTVFGLPGIVSTVANPKI